ncbi:MAG: hypothetical protein JKY66_03365, partial [Spongiibacteraceae bacterium]|nr:hypothetical protein [Spongiibacteraceae bacterium]
MTVENQTKKVKITGNASKTTFSFDPIVIFRAADLEVITTVIATGVETVRTEGVGATNWSTSLTTFPATGSIVYPADVVTPLPATETISIRRLLTLEQQTDLENQGGYFPETQETVFDKLVMNDIMLQEQLDRSIHMPTSLASFSTLLPTPISGDGGKILALNSGLTAWEYIAQNSAAFISVPEPSTDNGIVRYNGVTGSSFNDSGVLIDDNNRVTSPGGFITAKGADLASATATVIGTDGNYFDITGTTTITSFTVPVGMIFTVQFDGALLLTHNGTTLDLPTEGNLTTVAGDHATFFATAANAVQCINYSRAVGSPLLGAGGSGDLLAANNLSDLNSASSGRTNLGLAALAVLAT